MDDLLMIKSRISSAPPIEAYSVIELTEIHAQETPKLRWTFPAVPFRQETSDTVCTFSISPF